MQREFEVNAKSSVPSLNYRFQGTVESQSFAMEKLKTVIDDKIPGPLRINARHPQKGGSLGSGGNGSPRSANRALRGVQRIACGSIQQGRTGQPSEWVSIKLTARAFRRSRR